MRYEHFDCNRALQQSIDLMTYYAAFLVKMENYGSSCRWVYVVHKYDWSPNILEHLSYLFYFAKDFHQ